MQNFGAQIVIAIENARLRRKLRDLKRNSESRSMPGGGFVLISDISERKRAEQAIRTTRDPAETELCDFQPVLHEKPAGEGTGLGLSMSHDIVVKQHGDTIAVVTEPGSFAKFITTLPRVMPS